MRKNQPLSKGFGPKKLLTRNKKKSVRGNKNPEQLKRSRIKALAAYLTKNRSKNCGQV